jgi:hypothetical protein
MNKKILALAVLFLFIGISLASANKININSENITKEPEIYEDYFWKKPIVFNEEHDLTYFYRFYNEQKYPVSCWEVRTKQGETLLFDKNGAEIGCGIPTPYYGFAMSGFHEESWPDPWVDFRLNAYDWFTHWCDLTTEIALPSPSAISSYVSDPDYELFYELAHGAETYFQADWYGSYYTSTMTANDLVNREKMRFAFIGSCHGMTTTGPGTFSYEFRKGSLDETVTIGYDHMEECPGWANALDWQDLMFYLMDSGYTIKDAFDQATATYPAIAPAVVFVGDTSMKIFEEGEEPPEDENKPPNCRITYPGRNVVVEDVVTVTGIAYDVDGMIKKVYVQIGGGEYLVADGTEDWSYVWDTNLVENGEYIVTGIAWDGTTYTCHSISVTVKNTEEQEEPEPKSDLNVKGNLGWTNVNPEITVHGDFTVENIGDSKSLLNWEVSSYPEWGDWSFNPLGGNDLTPEQGEIKVQVSVIAPEEQEKTYMGRIEIVNKDNSSDYHVLEFTLSTPKSKFINSIIRQIIVIYPEFFNKIIKLFKL